MAARLSRLENMVGGTPSVSGLLEHHFSLNLRFIANFFFLQITHIDEKIDDIHKVLVLLTKNESASRNQSSFE